jgi:hypothetical protein
VAQKDTLPYNRKREIVYDGKRYRVYNSYLSFGGGKAWSDIRDRTQSYLNVDFTFHITKQYLSLGILMSGDYFLRNKNLSGHLCYAYRIEKEKYNLAGFLGPSYSYFATGTKDSSGLYIVKYNYALGAYLRLQAIYKVKYDVGIGLELFADISDKQKILGAGVVCYFSGAYRGEKRGYKKKKS